MRQGSEPRRLSLCCLRLGRARVAQYSLPPRLQQPPQLAADTCIILPRRILRVLCPHLKGVAQPGACGLAQRPREHKGRSAARRWHVLLVLMRLLLRWRLQQYLRGPVLPVLRWLRGRRRLVYAARAPTHNSTQLC